MNPPADSATAEQVPHAIGGYEVRGASREWGWQYVFPARQASTDPRSGAVLRHHLSEQAVQKAVKAATQAAGISKAATPHTFRHAFATHLIESGTDVRTVQALLGHASLKTTIIDVHVLNKGARASAARLTTCDGDGRHSPAGRTNEDAKIHRVSF